MAYADTAACFKQTFVSVSTTPEKKIDPDVQSLIVELSEKMGAQVSIDHNAKGKGKLTINFNDLDQLDGILSRIK